MGKNKSKQSLMPPKNKKKSIKIIFMITQTLSNTGKKNKLFNQSVKDFVKQAKIGRQL